MVTGNTKALGSGASLSNAGTGWDCSATATAGGAGQPVSELSYPEAVDPKLRSSMHYRRKVPSPTACLSSPHNRTPLGEVGRV